LVVITINKDASLKKEDIEEINLTKNKLVNNNPNTIIFIPGDFSSISAETRAYSATKKVYHNAIAKAIVGNIIGHRLIGNFFLKFNSPPAPTKIFSNQIDAKVWLEEKRIEFNKKNAKKTQKFPFEFLT
jgi:hypothetical protein